jgi:hypothetical protein
MLNPGRGETALTTMGDISLAFRQYIISTCATLCQKGIRKVGIVLKSHVIVPMPPLQERDNIIRETGLCIKFQSKSVHTSATADVGIPNLKRRAYTYQHWIRSEPASCA